MSMLCPWAMSFFQKLCPAPFPPVTKVPWQHHGLATSFGHVRIYGTSQINLPEQIFVSSLSSKVTVSNNSIIRERGEKKKITRIPGGSVAKNVPNQCRRQRFIS